MISLDTALDTIGKIKSFQFFGRIGFVEKNEILLREEQVLYGLKGTPEEREQIFEKAEKYYAPIIKNYHLKLLQK